MTQTGAIALAGYPALAPRRLARHEASTKLGPVNVEPSDDARLMLRYGAGDAAAFEELYSRHRAPLWRFVLRNLRDEAATADVFQDIWTRVIAHRERYTATAKFTTWLYRIAHNCCVDHWRRSGRAARREHPAGDDVLVSMVDRDAPTPDEDAQSDERAAALLAALRVLPDAQRTAFLMYVEGGLALPEIAAATGVGVETAKSRLRYAVSRLRGAVA
jgi:RNA polymerase sigma-70 factor (ECF subfamily)